MGAKWPFIPAQWPGDWGDPPVSVANGTGASLVTPLVSQPSNHPAPKDGEPDSKSSTFRTALSGATTMDLVSITAAFSGGAVLVMMDWGFQTAFSKVNSLASKAMG